VRPFSFVAFSLTDPQDDEAIAATISGKFIR
jgi:hypothetical protein